MVLKFHLPKVGTPKYALSKKWLRKPHSKAKQVFGEKEGKIRMANPSARSIPRIIDLCQRKNLSKFDIEYL